MRFETIVAGCVIGKFRARRWMGSGHSRGNGAFGWRHEGYDSVADGSSLFEESRIKKLECRFFRVAELLLQPLLF